MRKVRTGVVILGEGGGRVLQSIHRSDDFIVPLVASGTPYIFHSRAVSECSCYFPNSRVPHWTIPVLETMVEGKTEGNGWDEGWWDLLRTAERNLVGADRVPGLVGFVFVLVHLPTRGSLSSQVVIPRYFP